jgi:hypothetical protein
MARWILFGQELSHGVHLMLYAANLLAVHILLLFVVIKWLGFTSV